MYITQILYTGIHTSMYSTELSDFAIFAALVQALTSLCFEHMNQSRASHLEKCQLCLQACPSVEPNPQMHHPLLWTLCLPKYRGWVSGCLPPGCATQQTCWSLPETPFLGTF